MKYAILIAVAFIIAGCAATEERPPLRAEFVESTKKLTLDEQAKAAWPNLDNSGRTLTFDERGNPTWSNPGKQALDPKGIIDVDFIRGFPERGANPSGAAPMPFGDSMFGPWTLPERDRLLADIIYEVTTPPTPPLVPTNPKDE
jgi:hypothetical protein